MYIYNFELLSLKDACNKIRVYSECCLLSKTLIHFYNVYNNYLILMQMNK